MKIPQEVREKLELIFDETVDSETGLVLYSCPIPYANYLHRFAASLRNESALESLEIYRKGEPFYGKGIYYHLSTRACASGFICARTTEPHLTVLMQFIQAAFLDRDVLFPCPNREAARKRLNRWRVEQQKLKSRPGLEWIKRVRITIPLNSTTVTLTTQPVALDGLEEISPEFLDQIIKDGEEKLFS